MTRRRQSPYGVDWDALPLGQVPDEQIAGEVGCTVGLVRMHRARRGIPAPRYPRIEWDRYPIGEVSDVQIAALVSADIGRPVSASAVNRVRVARGLLAPPADGEGVGRSAGIDWDAIDLGQRSDAAIAASLNVTPSAVLYARRARGIPAWRTRVRR